MKAGCRGLGWMAGKTVPISGRSGPEHWAVYPISRSSVCGRKNVLPTWFA